MNRSKYTIAKIKKGTVVTAPYYLNYPKNSIIYRQLLPVSSHQFLSDSS